mmetsp:Transcript_24006/g.39083  ORF Transcript_24006/g.39083 Transcript_24006/m.39083 type:complete len:103 (-) Transcript_24006:372-680(-)
MMCAPRRAGIISNHRDANANAVVAAESLLPPPPPQMSADYRMLKRGETYRYRYRIAIYVVSFSSITISNADDGSGICTCSDRHHIIKCIPRRCSTYNPISTT